MQVAAIVVSLAITLVAVAFSARRSVRSSASSGPASRPRPHRPHGRRSVTMLSETLGHTRMLQWTHVGDRALVRVRRVRVLVLHPGHGVRAAVRRRVRAAGDRPLGGYEWATDLITWLMLVSILALILIRVDPPAARRARPLQRGSPDRGCGRAYFVEAVDPRHRPVHPDAARRGVRAGQLDDGADTRTTRSRASSATRSTACAHGDRWRT